MESKEIKDLITAFTKAELTSLSLKCEDFELALEKKAEREVQVVSEPTIKPETKNTVIPEKEVSETEITAPTKSILSPMVGTFYAANSPTAEPFIQVGSHIAKGDVVCMIEAMKLMNEVESEIEGEVIEVLVKNEEMVEYNQPLFILK